MLINKLTRISSSLIGDGYLVLLYIIVGLARISSMFYNVVNGGYTVTSDKSSEDLKGGKNIYYV